MPSLLVLKKQNKTRVSKVGGGWGLSLPLLKERKEKESKGRKEQSKKGSNEGKRKKGEKYHNFFIL